MARAALPALALLVLATACAPAGPGRGACPPREVPVANASSRAVEQLYLAADGQAGWGASLLSAGELPPGGTVALRLPGGPGQAALRIVWVDGRAAELAGLDRCAVARVTVLDGGLQAQ